MNKIPFVIFFLILIPVGLYVAHVTISESPGADSDIPIAPVSETFQSGDVVVLDTITLGDSDYLSWSQIPNGAPLVRLQNADSKVASFRIPYAVIQQTATLSFSASTPDGYGDAVETVNVPVTFTAKPITVLPLPESPSGFVETILFEQQWNGTDGWTLDDRWGIAGPLDTLYADTNNRVINIGECDGSCPLQMINEVRLSTYHGADLVFWVWFGDQIADTDSLNIEVATIPDGTADNWENKHTISVGDLAYEQWSPVTINFDEFAGDDFFFRFTPSLENDSGIIQIDAVQLIAKTADDVKPVISNMPEDIVRDVSGPSLVTFALPTAVDDTDGIVAVICDLPSRVVYPFGTTTVTCISRDAAGNTASASFDVTLNQLIPLEITAPDDLTLEADGELTPVDPGTASTNRDATVTNDAPGMFALGSTTITWTAKDGKGGTADDVQVITIQDTTDPVVTPPSDVTFEAAGILSLLDLGVATATDTVDAVPTIIIYAPTSFPIGTTTITYIATDDSGNHATDTQRVTVLDTEEPVLVLPSAVSAEATGVLTLVNIGTATVTDNIDSLTATNDSPDSFPLGETLVTWTAKDNAEEVTVVQTVIIRDTTKPAITVPENITAEARDKLTRVDIGSATASDIADSDVTITNDSPGSFQVGSTVITWTATDDSGNAANGIQTVRIQDTTKPVFASLPDDITVRSANDAFVEFETPTATDIFPVTVLCDYDSGDLFPVGSTLVTCTATDASGNAIQDSFLITVGPSIFETITDDFADLDSWEFFQTDGTPMWFDLTSPNIYTLELSATDGNPAPSALLRGDGFEQTAGITRDFSLENHDPDDPLYLSVDYRATSDSILSLETNARLEITDTDGNSLYQTNMIAGDTYDSGWQTFGTDISQYVSGQDDIRVRLYLVDFWIASWNIVTSFDNFYLGEDPLPSRDISSEEDILLTPPRVEPANIPIRTDTDMHTG